MNQQAPWKQRRDDGRLDIKEVFWTLQGEGPFAGRPAVFIRLAGCNLQCPGCDTDYTTNAETVDTRELIQCAAVVVSQSCDLKEPLAVITGGEPFRQDLRLLVRLLRDNGFTVQIETNGTFKCPKEVSDLATIVVSPKTPTISIRYPQAFKYVASADDIDPEDGLPRIALQHGTKRVARPPVDYRGEIYLQPADEQDPEKNANNQRAVVQACLNYGHRLCLQTHKIVGIP